MTTGISNLQILRLIAALLVVWFHWTGAATPDARFEVGKFGVDIFFVLSGFIMALITSEKRPSAGRFLRNRLARIVPLYWLLTLLLFAVATALPQFMASTTPDFPGLINSLFFIPHMRNTGEIQPLLFLGWTLNYEMFFYLLVALSLHFRRQTVVLAVTLAVLVIAGGVLAPVNTIARFYTDPLLLEFLAGFMSFHLWFALRRGPVAPAYGGICILAALLFLPLLWQLFPSDRYHRVLVLLLPAFLIVTGTAMLPSPRFFGYKALVYLGDASFAVYLIHPYLQKLLLKTFQSPEVPPAGLTVVMFCLVCGAGLVLYRYFETPAKRALRSKPAPTPRNTVVISP